ncbi:hypothetical protein R5R35_007024 [Gryllus longicercus]|uniref:Uncharacterized protein n=1 Tax=Gryllus longicercus TaxID=2509291 RepID=A0AAN9VVL0_9ORTH
MFLVLVLFCKLFLHFVNGNSTEVNIQGCKRAITTGYGYKVVYHIREAGEHSDNHLLFEFYVKAPSDAHILLSSTENAETPTQQDESYEIVLGGGKNSFSAIRSKKRGGKSTAAQTGTPNVLSPEEFRGFWIKLTPPGRLEVGKFGNEAPFMFWDDPYPIRIRFFAFCNWANYVGEWAYGCPNETQADEVAANLTTLEKLRSHLLTHYDPFSRPVIQINDFTTVYLQLLNKAVKLDEKQSKMTVTAEAKLQWQDQKIQWDPNEYGNITKLTMVYHDIWQPELFLYNAVGSGATFLVDDVMTVSPVGSVRWKSHFQVEVHCNMDLSKWPYDTQVCELQLGFWADQKYLKLLFGNEPEKEAQQTNSEWEIINLHYENIHIRTPWSNASDIPREAFMAIRYTLKRNTYMYRAVFGVPLLAISLMTLLPFWISPLHPHKLHISCLSLIVMSIFVITLARTLPAPADHVPGLVQTYSQGMVAITFSILVSVAIITMARSNHEHPVPQIIQTVLSSKYVQFLLYLTAMPNKNASDYGNLLEADNTNISQNDDTNSVHDVNNIQEQWISLAQLADRLSFIIYTIYLSTVFLTQV